MSAPSPHDMPCDWPVDLGQCDGCGEGEGDRECVYVDGFGWEWLCTQCAGNGDA